MGCGSSKEIPAVVEEGLEPPTRPASAGEIKKELNYPFSPVHREIITPPGVIKQNGTTNVDEQLQVIYDEIDTPTSGLRKGSEAIAFEISDDREGKSIIRKHPPKKLQKLEDLSSTPTLTPEELAKKQEIAMLRRQTIMNKRVQSAKQRSAKSAHIRSNTNTDDNDDSSGGIIESPEDM